ncbi:putative ABC efflux transporter (ATP-binding protein) [Streptococcus thermophilus]|uniref:ABC transporter ATP-binding protein n=1 Tax=Streptococcus thermophilus TaxID=1308 RepID=UPI0015C24CB3|nr:ATP-binding cassette domain-containing protein [Streptococcus thermophilus]CAD0146663.1 putative ABC efflux transporter (ATP-binding protein) [Streptococcus thermophilus]CAD0149026.1 putative ABC efflux transporter (ATP-binding protein) [Streptococcus thermophilus]
MKNEIILCTDKLTKKYGSQTAVNNVSLNVKKGRIYGLLGRNGAGKTTIMKMILGLTSIPNGSVTVFNQTLKGNENEIYPRIGSIIEIPGFYSNLTGTENLQVFARLRGTINKTAIQNALSVVGLPYNDNKTFSSYSLGMKQRLGIANAILNDPEMLILDEPTNGLDPIGIAEIRAFLKKLCQEQGKTIIISSHILSEIALLADDIGIIHEGILLEESTLDQLKKKSEQYILIQVPDTNKACYYLENVLGIKNYSVEDDHFIRIYDLHIDVATIGQAFFGSGIELTHLEVCMDNLEDYFKKITGGVGIA